jgi:hypothetical protein
MPATQAAVNIKNTPKQFIIIALKIETYIIFHINKGYNSIKIKKINNQVLAFQVLSLVILGWKLFSR